MQEIWKAIPEYEGLYEVSNLGRIKSLERYRIIQNRKCLYAERVLKTSIGSNGYLLVTLMNNCHKSTKSVHRLVLESFVGIADNCFEACHNNGNKLDNRLENLRWDTRKGNFADREAHGNTAKGSRNGLSKLTENAVIEIRNDTRSNRQIAKTYNVSSVCIDKIKNRTNWKHI